MTAGLPEALSRRGVLLGHLALAAGMPCAGAVAGSRLDMSRLTLSFEEQFDRLELYDERRKTGRWRTQYGAGGPDSEVSRTMAGGLACYVDAGFTGGAVNPFVIERHPEEGSILRIIADRTPPALLERCFGRPYTSGVLTTRFSFAQMYGYFEARMRLPAGRGYWPAFSALPTDRSWSTELDVIESLGDRHTVFMSVHKPVPGEERTIAVRAEPDLTSGFHDYGLWWDRDQIIWTIDGREYRRASTPPGAHKPLYWLFNMAIGGAWAGPPRPDTVFPASFQIAHFKAYRIAA